MSMLVGLCSIGVEAQTVISNPSGSWKSSSGTRIGACGAVWNGATRKARTRVSGRMCGGLRGLLCPMFGARSYRLTPVRPRGSIAMIVSMAAIAACMTAPLLQPSYVIGAALMLISSIVAVVAWPPAPDGSSTSTPGRSVWVTATIAAFLLIYRTALQWLPFVFAGPLDVNRGDMLVVTEAGVRRVLEGRTPYAMYHVPWEM